MPCDSIRTTSVVFQGTMYNVVAKAMEDLGWSVYSVKDDAIRFSVDGASGVLRNGTLSFSGSYGVDQLAQQKTQQLIGAYGKRIGKMAAKKFGFKFLETNEEGHYQFSRE